MVKTIPRLYSKNQKMANPTVSYHAAVILTGAILIAAYVLFGGPSPNSGTKRKKKYERGHIPGLTNVGNSCFLNCILQAVAACPSFIEWLELLNVDNPPTLLHSLRNLMNVLNSEINGGITSAAEVLHSLRSHGWVISPEEQDAHELFHALTSTLDDEVILIRKQCSSLLNVSWIKGKNGSIPAFDKVECTDQAIGEVSNQHHSSANVNGNDDSSVMSVDEQNSFIIINHEHGKSKGTNDEFRDITINKPSEGIYLDKSYSIISKVPTSMQFSLDSLKYNASTLCESPFKGHLASQLQCAVCGFRNAEQWSAFESLSLSLPRESSWKYKRCSLQELLDEFVSPETVSEVTCDGCTRIQGRLSRSSFSKQLTIGKLPECLCIHIQRTIWLENGSTIKRKDFVSMPETLNMKPYTYSVSLNQQLGIQSGLWGGRKPEDEPSNALVSSDCNALSFKESLTSFLSTSNQIKEFCTNSAGWKEHSIYKLKAVVVHVGDVFSGHFVTYRRGAINSSMNERWFYTSDVIVREVAKEEVLQSNAYMIIYERYTF